ncbi:MAG: M20/M25/M40 family metallo-hydrolase [Bryobacter sp.]|nr:M20/M25/M40 family metallo-hydrolase [Bryobacter sp.]
MKRSFLFLSAVLCSALALWAAGRFDGGDLSAEAKRWWSHVEKLSTDDMAGRDVGTAGYRAAAEYVAAQFEAVGLGPGANATSYQQKIGFTVFRLEEPKSSLSLFTDNKAEPLTLGEHAYLSVRVAPAAKLKAPMVFAGYATRVPQLNYDDFAGLDVRGKIVVYFTGQPAGVQGPVVSHNQSLRNQVLAQLGAVGVAVINNPATSDIPWARASQARFNPSMTLRENKTAGPQLKLSLVINPAHADKFFAGTGHTMDEIVGLARDKKPLPKFDLKTTLEARAAYTKTAVDSTNVIGIHWGSDPALKNEFIVVSAHLDHLGTNPKLTGDQIYNGAMDNSSGVASLIEAARHFRDQGIATKRSVAFVALTGEEKGLLGSRWYAENPVFGKEKRARVVANLNMDMYLPLFPLRALTILGVDESTLGDLAKQGAEEAGVEVWPDPAPERNSFVRSDQYSFIRNGTPALAFKFGYKPGTPEEATVKAWLKERYHAVSDDLAQPVDKEAAAKYNRVLASMILKAADAPAAPRWKESSPFAALAAKQ